jgi:hypothetical protein
LTRESVGSSEENESLIRDFLLGKTPEAERDRLEERLLADPAFSELVSAVEEELIDDYTAGLLFRDDRRLFEDSFLVTEERRRRVHFSAALAGVRDRPLPARAEIPALDRTRRGWMQVAAAAVAIVSLGVAVWMAETKQDALARIRAADEQIAALEQSRYALVEEYQRRLAEAEERAGTASTVERETRALRLSRSVTVEPPRIVATLIPGALRDPASSVPSLRIPPGTAVVELRLELAEDSYPGYAASVHDASGTELLRMSGLKSEAAKDRILLTLQVPAANLAPNDYSIRLWGHSQDGLSELDRYYVRILSP